MSDLGLTMRLLKEAMKDLPPEERAQIRGAHVQPASELQQKEHDRLIRRIAELIVLAEKGPKNFRDPRYAGGQEQVEYFAALRDARANAGIKAAAETRRKTRGGRSDG